MRTIATKECGFSHTECCYSWCNTCVRETLYFDPLQCTIYGVYCDIYYTKTTRGHSVNYMFCYNLMSTCVVWGKVTAVGVSKHNFNKQNQSTA